MINNLKRREEKKGENKSGSESKEYKDSPNK